VAEVDVVAVFLPKENFWPLDSYNIGIRPLMGKPIFMHVLEHIHRLVGIRRLKIIHFGDIDNSIFDNIAISKELEAEKIGKQKEKSEIVESIKNSYAGKPLLVFSACDLGILLIDNILGESLKNAIYIDTSTDRIIGLRLLIRSSQEKPSVILVERSLENYTLYPWDFLPLIQRILRLKMSGSLISSEAQISSSANIIGPCYIEAGVKILENATIKGPCYIGRGVIIGNNALIRESVIEANSIIGANMEVARSWLGRFSETHSGYIGDSIFSENVHVGAGFITANVRLDRREIKVRWFERKIDTGLKKLGVIMGSNVEVGIHSGTMPGVLIGNNVKIGPGTLVFNNIPDGATMYAKQHVVFLEQRS